MAGASPVPAQMWLAALSEQKHVHPGRRSPDRRTIELNAQPNELLLPAAPLATLTRHSPSLFLPCNPHLPHCDLPCDALP